MSRRDDLHNTSYQLRTMTTAYIAETVDQELQLSDLQQLNGAAAPVLLAWGMGVATGAMGMWIYENLDREKLMFESMKKYGGDFSKNLLKIVKN